MMALAGADNKIADDIIFIKFSLIKRPAPQNLAKAGFCVFCRQILCFIRQNYLQLIIFKLPPIYRRCNPHYLAKCISKTFNRLKSTIFGNSSNIHQISFQ